MSSLSRELVFLILQFLDEEKFKETVHKLEQESGFYFNMKHFEDLVQAGEWDEVERYLGGFTKVEDNRYSMKIFFEIRKQKYLEALDRHDRAKAVEILVKDLKVFASFNEELFKEITQLLTLENFRQNEQLSKYGDTKSARNIMLLELKKLIEANPLFRDKLTFPPFKASRLRTLINQSLNWQHQLCKNPRPNPDIKTLFTDHSCAAPTNGARAPPPTNGPLVGAIPKSGQFPPMGAHGIQPFQPVVSPPASAIAGWMTNANPPLPHAAMAQGPPGLVQPPNTAAFLKHPRTPTSAPGMDYQTADSEHLMKRMRMGQTDEVSFPGATHPPNIYSQDDIPKSVVRTLSQGSNIMSLDFHPVHQTILLVGTNVGDIAIWEVGSRERIVHRTFKVWEIGTCTVSLQAALMKDAAISVNRCLWSPDGSIFGIAFSKHIVQIYAFNINGELRQPVEIDAHVGGVNDIAFSHPTKSLSIITCGDDKTIKVWDATTGQKQYTFEGHDAPVYSVCPHYKESIQFIFSTAIDGKIKAWLYDCLGSRVDYDAPGRWCTTMAYSADGTRLFSCGTSKDGESHLVEWNETEGAIKRTYSGFRKRSLGVVQFDTTKNRFLAAGDEFMIKFWDMDNINILTTTDADGGLPASPRLRFNREGSLLAVTTSDNGLKILANADGQRLVRVLESRAFEGTRVTSQQINANVKAPIVNALGAVSNVSSPIAATPELTDRTLPVVSMSSLAADIKPKISDDSEKIKCWKLADIVDSAHLKALRLPDPVTTSSKVVRLLYTNSGLAVLALGSNAIHKLWKWTRNERNPKLNVIATYIAKLGSAAGLALFIALLIKFLAGLPASDDTPAEKGQQFLNIFIVVVTIIVVAVPEGLPLAVTLALAFATTRMLRDANLVRHLKACEVMGNASTICSDKTGTLTQNKMQVVSGTIGTSLRFGGSSSGDASGASTPVDTSGDISISEFAKMLSKPVKDLLLKSIALNSTAFEGEVDGEKTFIGSKTETALLILAKSHLGMGPVSEERENAKVLQLIPFDSGRKCMGIVTQGPNGSARLYIKGASEIILSKCTQVLGDPANDDSLAPMSDDNVSTVQQLIESYARRSLRTIGICYKDFPSWPPKNAGRVDGGNEVVFDDLFSDMAFIGVVGIQDPLREGVPEAVKLCQQAGVVVRMVTGDNKITAEAIAKECGIIQPNSIVMEGPEFRNLSKLEQEEIIPRLHVLARSSPEDKRILVKRLKDKNETVAVTGDGTNDAPALKMADVGFSMGISGTEVAKEASAIILMDDNFTSIVKALKWGRAVNDAVKRFLQFQLTVNITAVILTFVTAVSNNEESSVLTAVQLLWVNLIMDTLAALALATDPPHDSVLDRKPEPKGSSIISVTMWKMILGQSIYQLVITFVLYYQGPIVPIEPKPSAEEIKTLVFNTFVWMQIFNQWNNRRLDNKFNIFEGLTKNWFFIGISAIMCGGQILIIFVGGEAFQIAKKKQSGELWAMAIVLGFLSIPVGVIIRLIPDHFLEALIPEFLKQRAKNVPGLTVSDEEMSMYPEPLADVRDELNFLRRMKGGRLNNLKFAIQHPKEAVEMVRSRSPSHSRSNSLNAPQTPIQENPFEGSPIGTPNSGRRPRSTRSRSNSALGAPTVMAGIVAAGVAAGWQPKMRPDNDGDHSDSPR